MNLTEKIAAVAVRLHRRRHTPGSIGVHFRADSSAFDAALGAVTRQLPPPARPAAQWLPFGDLTVCEQATRVASHVQRLMDQGHVGVWTLAETAATQDYAPTPQDISDLLHGMRHLRGAAEVRALAAALGVAPDVLREPGWPQ